MEELIGQTLDRYQITELLYEDSLSKVFKAYDPKFDRSVAIYLIGEQDEQDDYFLHSVRTILSWRQAGLARLFDFGTSAQKVYAVQEFIPGSNLQQILSEMRQADCWISLEESVSMVKELCLAVEFIHQRGVVHGDLQPANVFIKPEASEYLPYQPVVVRTGLIKPGMNLLPPASRPPEVASGGRVEKPADIYALGAILYELTTGQPPTPQSQIASGPAQVLPPHLLHPDLPEWLEKVILKALSPNPDDRFKDASEIAASLNQAQTTSNMARSAPSGISHLCQLLTFFERSLKAPQREEHNSRLTAPGALPPIPTPDNSQDTVYVLMPDKSVRNFKMTPGGLTIGRNKENDIPLDLPGISRHHARVDFDGQNYIIRDLNSLNGTFMEQKRLSPEKSYIWNPGENLRIGEAWLRIERQAQTRTTQAVVPRDLPTNPVAGNNLPETDEVFVGPNGESVDSTQVMRSPGLGWVGVFTNSLSVSVAPGASQEISILLFNRGPANDSFNLDIQGIPLEWVPNPPQFIRVPSNGQREVRVVVRPPRSPLVKAGRYGVLVRVTSQNSTNQTVELRLTLTVTAFSLFASELRPDLIQTGDTGQVFIHNRGNLPETFAVTWEDRSHTLVFDPPQVKVNLQVGKSAVVEFRPGLLQPRLVGQEMTHQFRVHVSSQGGQTAVHEGEFISRGIVPPWAPIALAGVMIILACVICLLVNQVTFPIRRADRTAQAGRTALAQATQTAVYLRTATSMSLEGANLATLQAATATAAWLTLDEDSDGLTNGEEIQLGTLPDVADTDQDGLSDGIEVQTWKTNPLMADSDGDGLSDGVEVERGTNPLEPDTDGDGLNDAIDPDPLHAPTRTEIIYLPTATPPPPFIRTPTRTNTPTLSPTPKFANLSVSVSNGQANSVPGTNTVYTLLITNQGPSGVNNAKVIDDFPSTLSNISWLCSASPGSHCLTLNGIGNINALVNLAPGGTATLTVNANIAPNATGTLANTARVVTPAGIIEQNPLDNQATDTDSLSPHAALSLSKTDNRDSILPGQSTNYTIIVYNNGPSTVGGIKLQDSLPSQLTGISWNCGATTGSNCSPSGVQNGDVNAQISLNPNGSATVNISAIVKNSASGTINNTASITSPIDPGSNNKSVTDTTVIIPQADLTAKVEAPETVATSDPLTYTIWITNTGPSTASSVILTDTLSSDVTFVSSNPEAPDCQLNGNIVRCSFGNLSVNSSVKVEIVVTAPLSTGSFQNVIEIKAPEVDPNPANNVINTSVTAT